MVVVVEVAVVAVMLACCSGVAVVVVVVVDGTAVGSSGGGGRAQQACAQRWQHIPCTVGICLEGLHLLWATHLRHVGATGTTTSTCTRFLCNLVTQKTHCIPAARRRLLQQQPGTAAWPCAVLHPGDPPTGPTAHLIGAGRGFQATGIHSKRVGAGHVCRCMCGTTGLVCQGCLGKICS